MWISQSLFSAVEYVPMRLGVVGAVDGTNCSSSTLGLECINPSSFKVGDQLGMEFMHPV